MAASPKLSEMNPQPQFWLSAARFLQALVICLTVGLFIISLPMNYERRIQVCSQEPCPPGQLTSASQVALEAIGLSVEGLVQITIGLDVLSALAYTACAVIIFIRKPNDAFTIFVTIMLVTFGVATFSGGIQGAAARLPQLQLVTKTIEMIGNCAMVAFLLIFPSGKFTPRWTAVVLAAWILFQLPRYYLPGSPSNLEQSNPSVYNLLFLSGIVISLATQIIRYRRVYTPVEKQQAKWVVYGLAIGIGGYLSIRMLSLLIPDPLGRNLPVSLGLGILSTLVMLLLPLSIGVAVLRFRLWDINPIINRTLVYGALSASTMAVYILAVGFFANYFQNNTVNFIISFIATGFIAILFQPLRERLQRGVNRIMYGERDDPATALTRLSQRLDTTLTGEAVLPTIVETIAQTLRVPYTAISLTSGDGYSHIMAEYGRPVPNLLHFPLSYQSRRIGEILLAPRAPDEALSPADMRLLNIIALQTGVAAQNIQLTNQLHQLNTDLQRSREHLVNAQEEERRRLRRDLHDGVGPTLASLTQRLDAAADLVAHDPPASIEMLQEIKRQVKGTLAEIRRLVYILRPPVLDEFGLVSAIREHIAPYSGPTGLTTSLNATEPMPSLPAAVEVAAYRIILEAFTNVVQHAQARACTIEILQEDSWLLIKVVDDGLGRAANSHSGVGLSSIRERASELGGECSIDNLPSGGTRVLARLPLPGGKQ